MSSAAGFAMQFWIPRDSEGDAVGSAHRVYSGLAPAEDEEEESLWSRGWGTGREGSKRPKENTSVALVIATNCFAPTE